MIREIKHCNDLYAIVIGHDFQDPGVKFVTPDTFSQQLAVMNHPKGKIIEPHFHNSNTNKRKVFLTQEVLVLRKGKLRVDFYTIEKEYFGSTTITGGDAILLTMGGHGFEVLEDLEMIEIKQGPHTRESDKTRFSGQLEKIKFLERE